MSQKTATLYRMKTDKHVCPFGLRSLDLLKREGFTVEDNILNSRDQTDAFMAEQDVKTTPQTFIDGDRIGGYEDLRRHLGKPVKDGDQTTYTPIIAIFAVTALMALVTAWMVLGTVLSIRTIEWFIAFSMCVLAIQKLRDLDGFVNQVLGYDLLAQRYVPYGYFYPFAEAFAGIAMIAGAVTAPVAAPVALFIGVIGGVSVFKAVYIDKRDLKCACVGGESNVPLGFVSLTENIMMVAMAIWMLTKPMIT